MPPVTNDTVQTDVILSEVNSLFRPQARQREGLQGTTLRQLIVS